MKNLEIITVDEYHEVANTKVKTLSKLQTNSIILDVFQLLIAVEPLLFENGKFVKPNWYNFAKWFKLAMLVLGFISKVIANTNNQKIV